MSSVVEQLIRKYPLISDQIETSELTALLSELEKVIIRNNSGAIVEFGCFRGTTSLFIRRLLDCYESNFAFHVYDSFAGLPDKTSRDQSPAGMQFVAGELLATKKDFILQFKKSNLRPPIIHKTWFADVEPDMVPDSIRFAFLDGDYYESIRDSFAAIETQLSSDAVIIVDDYQNEALPGAQKATDEWLRSHPRARMQSRHSLAIITL